MEFFETVKSRYSCKSYDGRRVDRDKLNEILLAGSLAPTAKNAQEQRVYVIENAEVLKKLDNATPCRYNAGTVIAVAYEKSGAYTYPDGKRDSGAEDAAIVATHMMLAAASLGIASCWLNCFDTEKAKAAIGVPNSQELVMLLDVGYPAPGSSPLPNHFSRKPLSETVKFID